MMNVEPPVPLAAASHSYSSMNTAPTYNSLPDRASSSHNPVQPEPFNYGYFNVWTPQQYFNPSVHNYPTAYSDNSLRP